MPHLILSNEQRIEYFAIVHVESEADKIGSDHRAAGPGFNRGFGFGVLGLLDFLLQMQINELTKTAREENDFASDQFMQWFIKEQVDEVATMSELVAVARRSQNNVEAIEEYVQREQKRQSADPTAPEIAGG